MATLVVDSRETNVTRHTAELANTPMVRRMITVGDYAIVDKNGKILVSIERKSLEDYASSIKDGRISNIVKMVELREETGCRLILLIEGKPAAKHGGIPYRAIESSMWHNALRHNIILLFTQSTVETAALLARLVVSMTNLQAGHSPMQPAWITYRDEPVVAGGEDGAESKSNTVAPPGTPAGGLGHTAMDPSTPPTVDPSTPPTVDPATPPTVDPSSVPDLLMAKRSKTTHEIAREIMAVIGGITIDSADDYLVHYSLKEILLGADISAIKLSSGRRPTTRVSKGVSEARKSPAVWKKMLFRIPRITADTASKILEHGTLPRLLTWSADSLGIITIAAGKKKDGTAAPRKLTAGLAARILECFEFKLKT